MDAFVAIAEWIGTWPFGTFTTAYLGYTTARTVDKREPALKDGADLLAQAVRTVL